MHPPLTVNTDFIGDVHAGYDKLSGLLAKLGYHDNKGIYTHPDDRKLCFLGDILNIGNDNLKVIGLIRSLSNQQLATCICGNHEFTLFRYWRSNPHFFEDRQIPKNFEIYLPFLKEIRNKQNFTEVMEWIAGMPVYVITEYFTAVHAYWNDDYSKILEKSSDRVITADETERIFNDDANPLRSILFNIIFGKRITLPDPDNPFRSQMVRYRWWDTHSGHLYSDVVLSGKNSEFHKQLVPDTYFTKETKNPVFFGHYWLKSMPCLTNSKFCCLDFGGSKGGHLAAYRFDGKTVLSDQNLLFL